MAGLPVQIDISVLLHLTDDISSIEQNEKNKREVMASLLFFYTPCMAVTLFQFIIDTFI